MSNHSKADDQTDRVGSCGSSTTDSCLVREIAMPLLTVAILIVLSWYARNLYRDFRAAESQHHRIIELNGVITHLDEVLTMSARMAAASGDLKWETRYRSFEAKLDAGIKEAIGLAPEAFMSEAVKQTDAANIKLVALENEAFDLVRQGDREAAAKVLYSPAYEKQKRLYSGGMAQTAAALEKHIEHRTNKGRRAVLGGFISVAFLMSLALFGWFVALRMRRDFVRRKQVEQELLEAKGRVEQTNLELEASAERAGRLAQDAAVADLAKSQFLANVSHEVRTPMNAIIGFSDVLSAENLTDEQAHHVRIIRESAEHLLHLINNILDFSKIEAGELDIEIVDCSLEQVLAVVESLMRPSAKEKGLAFEILQCAELPARMRTDPVRLRQCLVNLINNAIKFTEEGHVYVNVSQQKVDDKLSLCFDIEDTGIGIPADKHEMIFEEFTQMEGGTTRRYSGTGLGLPITRKLAHLLGGEVTLTSEEGKGSVLSLAIPAGVCAESQPVFNKYDSVNELYREPDMPDTLKDAKFSGRVLVAEDSRSNQMLAKCLLERLGLQVTIAEDGKEAVQKALSEPYDLIFMDIQMPKMDGYEVTRTLRRKGIRTAIVALTAYALRGDDEKCIAAGCSDYIAKPIDRKILLKVICKYLPCESRVLTEEVNSAEGEGEQIRQRVSGTAPQGEFSSQSLQDRSSEEEIDWTDLVGRFGDDGPIREVVEAFLADNPARMKSLSEAIEAGDAGDVQSCAHAVKGSAAVIGARRLSEAAYRLELAADEQKLETAEALLADLYGEFERLKTLLSQADWTEIARQHGEKPAASPANTS